MHTDNALHSIEPLAQSSHAKPVDSFSQALELEQELKLTVRGEVRFDTGSRALYSMDASNYRQVPIGVAIPRDVEDVVTTITLCREHAAPLLCRGGGTGLRPEILPSTGLET